MPQPRTYDLPGRWGINLQEKDALLHHNWATKTESLVLDENSHLQCRGGFNIVSTDGAAGEILRAHIYIDADGDETVITSQATKIVSGIADLDDVSTDITSTTVPTNGFWQFINFNGKVLGWQAGHTPIVKTTGDFADITASAGSLPTGDVACAAYGRVWAVDSDRQTVRYCALLDETDWSTASGGGSIDMRNVWTDGMDYVTGIAAFGGALVIFGRRHIIMYTDGQGSPLGIDPTQMYVVDTIEGTGCVARDSIAAIGEGDLVYLSANGVQSLARTIVQKGNPLDTISWQISDTLKSAIKTEITAQSDPKLDVRGFTGRYIDSLGQYWLIHNNGSVEDVYIFQMTAKTQDEDGRQIIPIMFWDTSVLTNLRNIIETNEKIIYVTGGATHELYTYSLDDNTDQGSTAIAVDFETGWIFDEDPTLKVLKFGQVTLLNVDQVSSATTFKYATDYQATLDTLAAPASSDGRIVNLYDPVGDVEGQYFKIGISDSAFGGKVLQQMKLFLEGGRTSFIHQKFDDYTAPQALEDAGAVTQVIGGGGGGYALDFNGNVIDNIKDVPTIFVDTDGTADQTIDLPMTVGDWQDNCSGFMFFMTTSSGLGSTTLQVNVAGINADALTNVFERHLDTAGVQNQFFYGYIYQQTGAPDNNQLRLVWSSAPAAGITMAIKIIPLVDTDVSEWQADYEDAHDLNAVNTMTVTMLGAQQADALVFLAVVVHPEAGTTLYPVTVPSTTLMPDTDEDLIWESSESGAPQMHIWMSIIPNELDDYSGNITVGGTIPAGTGGAFYIIEMNTVS